MIQIVQSHGSGARLDAAAKFVHSFPAGTEILIVGATRDAVDDFARDVSVEAGATFGLHRLSFMQLVSYLATGPMATRGLAPASTLGMEAVAARAAFEADKEGKIPRLAPVIQYPGFARALAATLTEVRLAGIDHSRTRDWGGDTLDLAILSEIYEKELAKAKIADRRALLELAREGLESRQHETLRKTPFLLLDLSITSFAEREFLKSLITDSPAILATLPAGDGESLHALQAIGSSGVHSPRGVDSPREISAPEKGSSGTSLERLQAFLFAEETPPAGEGDEHVRFFSAPGEGRECVEIARQILAAARGGVPFDEMAVFVRASELYSVHLETAMRRAGIPAYFAKGTKRPDPSGRAFLALLACKSEGLSAKLFAEYLSFAQVPDLGREGKPPADREVWSGPEEESLGPAVGAAQLSFQFMKPVEETEPGKDTGGTESEVDTDETPALAGSLRAPWKWEELLVEAAVIGGHDRWRRRLKGLEKELRIKVQETESEEPDSPRALALRRHLANLGHLERFALAVIDKLDNLHSTATWGEWIDSLSGLAPMVLRRPERVLTVLAEMEPMGDVGPVGMDEVRLVLSQRLSNLEAEQPANRYGCVFVATPEQARGRSFKIVFVPGLTERVFPQRPREDPLLLDASRRRVSAELRNQEDRGQSERLLLRLAVGAAEDRVVLSYPRVDVVEARPRVPSFYGLDVARATRGSIPDYEQMEREAASLAQARLAWPSPPEPSDAIDSVEHDLSVLGSLLQDPAEETRGRARYLFTLNEHLERSLRSRWVRWRKKTWWPEDGIVKATEMTEPILDSQRPRARPYSVTALQKFATCPYQFFLSAIHRLEPREESAPLIQMDPLTRGRMLHEIQAEALRSLQDSKSLPVTPESFPRARVVLDEVTDRIAAEYRENLAPAIPRVWEDEVQSLRADLRFWLKQMSERWDEWVPKHFEFRFGLPFEAPFDRQSIADPVTLPGGWKLRGAIDLIEESPRTGKLRVTDHKSGANRTREGTVVGGGEVLQPVLYSLAVEAAMERDVVEARLDFCTSRGGFTDRVVAMDEWARRYGGKVLEAIDRSIQEGALPPAPRERACAFCDFRPVCGPHEERRTKRKSRDLLKHLEDVRLLP